MVVNIFSWESKFESFICVCSCVSVSNFSIPRVFVHHPVFYTTQLKFTTDSVLLISLN